MGNNKGRSDACRTCLKRRVKCDKTHPKCTRCTKGKFTCLGYRETLFIDGGEQIRRRLHSQSILQSRKNSPLSNLAKSETQPPEFITQSSTQSSQVLVENLARSQYRQPCHTLTDYPLHYARSCLSALPWRDDIFLAYLLADLGPMGTLFRKLNEPSKPDSSQRSVTMQSFLALATTFYGVGHAAEFIVNDGRRLYSQALTMLNTTISEPSRVSRVETLCSVVALSFHEAIAPTVTNTHTWLRHIQGLEQLFEMHGPTTDKSDPLIRVLVDNTRLIMITAALHTRRPSLMAHPEWRAVRDDKFERDSALAYILDALAKLPGLYSEYDDIMADLKSELPGIICRTACRALSPIQSLLTSSIKVLDNVRSQRSRWLGSHPYSEFPRVPSKHSPTTSPCPCPIVTHFSNFHAANAFTFYHCILILFNQFIISVYQVLPVEGRDPLVEELAAVQVSVAAVEILKSIDYHLPYTETTSTPIVDGSGPRNFYLMFPIRVAYQALSQSKSADANTQKLWLKDVFAVIKSRAGPWASNQRIFAVD